MMKLAKERIAKLEEEVAQLTQEIEARQIYILKAQGAIEALTQLTGTEDGDAEVNSDSGGQEQQQPSDS